LLNSLYDIHDGILHDDHTFDSRDFWDLSGILGEGFIEASRGLKELHDVVFDIFMRAAAVKNVGCTSSIPGGRVFREGALNFYIL